MPLNKNSLNTRIDLKNSWTQAVSRSGRFNLALNDYLLIKWLQWEMKRRSIEGYKPGVAGVAGYVYRKIVRATGICLDYNREIWTHVNVSRALWSRKNRYNRDLLLWGKRENSYPTFSKNCLRNIWFQPKCFVAIFVFPHAVIVHDCSLIPRLHATHSCQRRCRPGTSFAVTWCTAT
jgi:hypothetical protein